jgi:prolyl oligopeptidase
MCAALQHATIGARPIVLRTEGDVGHGARAVSRTVELAVDSLSFVAAHTGLTLSAT